MPETEATPAHYKWFGDRPKTVQSTDRWLCSIDQLAQGQSIIEIDKGRKIQKHYAILKSERDRDPQSDFVGVFPSTDSAKFSTAFDFDAVVQEILQYSGVWIERPLTHLEYFEEPAAIVTEIEWPPPLLTEVIVGGRCDWDDLREPILLAEDIDFTRPQGERLAPRLIQLALQHCDSNDPADAAPVWSAIRTGASMLRPDQADHLLPLLNPHHIETMRVTVKMLGRIFEAQPPEDVDQYPEIAGEAKQIIDDILNRTAIATSQTAALAQLAIYALAAMASTEILNVASAVRELDVAWFTRRTVRKLRDLQECWQHQCQAVAEGPRNLLENALREVLP